MNAPSDAFASCPHCAANAFVVFKASDYNRKVTEEHFTYRRCSGCGLVFLDEVPSNLGSYYPKGYHIAPSSAADLEPFLAAERYKVDTLKRFSLGNDILEIGPSFGAFAYLARQSGFHVRTIEMDSDCSKFLADVLGIPTINTSDVVNALAQQRALDAVVMWHSLEHMPNALDVVGAAARCLRKGGVLIVATPNPASLQLRLFGRYWIHLDAPRHVCLVPTGVLAVVLGSKGCRLEYVTTNDQGSRYCRDLGWQVSPLNAFGRPHSDRWFRYPGRLMARILRFIEDREGNGAAYTAVFRRAI